ncbi:MAG: ATP-dependent DNA helicase RecG [Spirochaetes bacterium]|nr:ATP-dependent DNA helicase RecG [Spirochaetota bacterium]
MIHSSVQYIKGIGPKKAELLRTEAGIETIEDLLYYVPRRYVDRTSIKSIGRLAVGEIATVIATVEKVSVEGIRRKYLDLTVNDGTGILHVVFFGGIHYLQKMFSIGDTLLFSGKVDYYKARQMVHPDFDFIDTDSRIASIHAGRIVPLYRSTEKLRAAGFDSRGFRRIIRTAIDLYAAAIVDPLEEILLKAHNLLPLKDALISIHFPESFECAEKARRRLAFNELFFLQCFFALARNKLRREEHRRKFSLRIEVLDKFVARLPFTLTDDQKKAILEITESMNHSFPMNRMLQGDVGAGKTVVAMAASLLAASRGEQTAMMAPTEILAAQHYENFSKYLDGLINVELLTGSTPKSKREEILNGCSRGEIHVLIGTHALIQPDVSFSNLGLIIIDEQHRFGVRQRALLREKGHSPDLLVMTATPIPRSLSLTLYGDLDVTIIRQKPANRLPIQTLVLPESRKVGVFNSIRKYVLQKQQVYYVLPLVDESEKVDLQSAKEAYEELCKVFPEFHIELLHGKMPQEQKDQIMSKFKYGFIDILVTTSVIEVGVDVPNATVMVVQHAERFGLSQLHQLRGRVGRGSAQSFCVLMHPDDVSHEALERLRILERTDDGFAIAEEDLKIRGSGEILGTRQHGYGDLEFSDLSRDIDLIIAARKEAQKMIETNKVIEGDGDFQQFITRFPFLQGIRSKRILEILS